MNLEEDTDHYVPVAPNLPNHQKIKQCSCDQKLEIRR